MGNRKFALKSLKDWTLDITQNELPQIELKDFKIMKSFATQDNKNLTLNDFFAKTLQRTFMNGYFDNFLKLSINFITFLLFLSYQTNFTEADTIMEKDLLSFNEEMKEFSRSNWRKVKKNMVTLF